MPNFRVTFFKEYKRFACKKNLLILAILILLLQYSVQKDIRDYQDFTIKSNEFQANEALAFKNMINYTNISSAGINILFFPAASGIFFTHPPLMTELSANINTIVNLDIKNNCQGKSLFISGSIFQICFANILLLLGSLASLFIGIDAFRDQKYLKSLCSLGSSKKIFTNITLSRLILIAACFFTILIVTLVHIFIKGFFTAVVDIPVLAIFSMIFLLTAVFFFLAGVITGFIFSPRTKTAFILVIWIFFAWLIPGIFQTLITNEAESISSHHKLYNEKITIINEFEKAVKEKTGKFQKNKLDIFRTLVEGYWNNEYKIIESKDNQFKGQIEQVIEKYYTYFMWTPTTYYYATSDALSSRGYNNFLAFSDYVWDLRRQFVRFWIERVYYNNPRQIVPFIKNNENLFHARSRLPGNFISGLLINTGYIFILFVIAFFFSQKYLYVPGNREPVKANNPLLAIAKGEIKTLWVPQNAKGFSERLYNLFSGHYHTFNKNEPDIKLKIGDIDYTGSRSSVDFFYVCHPAELPGDMKVKDFITFNFRLQKIPLSGETRRQVLAASGLEALKDRYIDNISLEERGKLLLTVLPNIKRDLYLVDTVTTGMSLHFTIRLNDIMKGWAETGSVIFLTQEREVKVESAEILAKDMNFHEQDMWSKTVSRLKELGYAGK